MQIRERNEEGMGRDRKKKTYDLLGVVFGLSILFTIRTFFEGVFRDSSLIPLFIGFAVNRSQKTNNPTHKSALELFTIDRLHNNNLPRNSL